MYKKILKTVVGGMLASSLLVEADGRPNVIVIMADDMGWGDPSCQPQELDRPGVALDTPNIDRLAEMGVRCTQGYATAPICAPSRAGFKTGRYQQTFGYYEFYQTLAGIPQDIPTIGEVFKQNGYATALFGKVHSMNDFTVDDPGKLGFDEWYSFVAQHDYYDPRNGQPTLAVPHAYDCYMYENGVPDKSEEMEYLTDGFTRRAVDFIGRMSKAKKPFFMYVPYNAPHPPLQAKWEKLQKYFPEFGKKGFTSRDLARAMIDSMDEGIGQMLDELEKQGQLDNTLIFLTSDNGGHDDGRELIAEGKGALVQHNGGLRARKGYYFEGGIRVPYIVAWPKRLPAGKVYEHPVSHLDIYATVVAAAECDGVPENLDGVDLAPYFSGEKSGMPHDVLYWGMQENANRWAVRKGDWKLIKEFPFEDCIRTKDFSQREFALYNLKEDPKEKNNVMDSNPEVVKELLRLRDDFYFRSEPSIVTPEQDKAWRADRQRRLDHPDGARRRDGYPGCYY